MSFLVADAAPPAGDAVLLNAALESMPYGFSVWNREFRLLLWNCRYIEIYRLPEEKLRRGIHFSEMCELTVAAGNHANISPAALWDLFHGWLVACRETSQPSIHEKEIRGRAIKATYVHEPAFGWMITHEDVTAQVMQIRALEDREAALERQNTRFVAAVDHMSHGLCMFDRDGRLVICNDRYATLYGVPRDLMRPGTTLKEILQNRIERGIHPVMGARAYVERRMELVAGGKDDTDIVELQDGRVISILHHPMSDGGWVSTHQDITEQRRAEARIHHLARHDMLTNLPNRMYFREQLAEVETRTRRHETLALLCIDLDHFKTVNDTLGHAVGDEVLKGVAKRLLDNSRMGDVVARFGGDEFVILTGTLTSPANAATLADRITKAMAEPFVVDIHDVVIGASVGIAVAPGDGTDADTLLRHADLALYRAKAEGRGTYHFFQSGLDEALQRRLNLEAELRVAIAKGQLGLSFLPFYSLPENRISGFEALIRWHHPTRGTILPEELIPLAEETGLIVPIGEWVLKEACAAAARWPHQVRVAVNLSPVQFKYRDLVEQVLSALATSGLNPDRLEIEINEAALLGPSELTLKALRRLHEAGVRVAMDDFGTGYSSLSHLRSFPFDKVKIDRSFIGDLATDDDRLAIVKAVIALGRSLGIATAAEGVESEAHLALVREHGCSEAQGFLFGQPLPSSAVAELLAAQMLSGDAASLRAAS